MSPLVNGLMEQHNIRKSEDVDVVNRWVKKTQLYIKDEHTKVKLWTAHPHCRRCTFKAR